MLKKRRISECANKHFFVGSACPWCRERAVRDHPFYDGDCVGCGALCAIGQYCCTGKDPMTEDDFDEIFSSREKAVATGI